VWTALATELPPSVRRVLEGGAERLFPKRILLFGSRARGSHGPLADFDVAFEGVERSLPWLDWANEQLYEPSTLWRMDLVRLEEARGEFRDAVLRDGRVLYERPS
jgi:predicted nucleotidyltransferase